MLVAIEAALFRLEQKYYAYTTPSHVAKAKQRRAVACCTADWRFVLARGSRALKMHLWDKSTKKLLVISVQTAAIVGRNMRAISKSPAKTYKQQPLGLRGTWAL